MPKGHDSACNLYRVLKNQFLQFREISSTCCSPVFSQFYCKENQCARVYLLSTIGKVLRDINLTGQRTV